MAHRHARVWPERAEERRVATEDEEYDRGDDDSIPRTETGHASVRGRPAFRREGRSVTPSENVDMIVRTACPFCTTSQDDLSFATCYTPRFKDRRGRCIGLQSGDEQATLAVNHVVPDRGCLIRRRRGFSVNSSEHSLIALVTLWSVCVTRGGLTQIALTRFRVQSVTQIVNTKHDDSLSLQRVYTMPQGVWEGGTQASPTD